MQIDSRTENFWLRYLLVDCLYYLSLICDNGCLYHQITRSRCANQSLARVVDRTRGSALDQVRRNERPQTMNIEEIKEAVKNLSREDLGIFRRWFWEFDQERWDEEIQEDVKAGPFDSILREVDRDAH